ncbi:hypothetical protein [Agromyces larvae]|uniref:DUF4333 domain-containing protein n=1 Tax=Agromyces larvae TaxID=2929802 RepID=A0ABY4C3R6_9MICO|nr:hypothetical protein [Agromyces larvae]UOE45964.1 hypothetical protein MTO99_09545 [Agromyces larvae]
MKKTTALTLAATAAVATTLGLSGCTTDADTASYNLSQAAEQFEIERRITVTTGFANEVALQVEGRCSVESADSFLAGALEITCKIGPDRYAKHFVVKGDNDIVTIQQTETVDVSVYHHRVLIKPENLLPEFDYEAGEQ